MYIALLFIIVVLYVYETYTDLSILQNKKQTNEKFVNYKNHNELYNKHRDYFGRRYLVQEGVRRNKIKDNELQKLKTKLNSSNISERERKEIEAELMGNEWREYMLKRYNSVTGEKRTINDYITDYNPNIIGCPRSWMECHTYHKY